MYITESNFIILLVRVNSCVMFEIHVIDFIDRKYSVNTKRYRIRYKLRRH